MRIVLIIAFFIARRNEIFDSSWPATLSATSELNLLAGHAFQFFFQLVHFRAFAADDDARTRRVNRHGNPLVGGIAFDLDHRDTGALQAAANVTSQAHIVFQLIAEFAPAEPIGFPITHDAQTETDGVCFLAQVIS
jgi:hypothetical protein